MQHQVLHHVDGGIRVNLVAHAFLNGEGDEPRRIHRVAKYRWVYAAYVEQPLLFGCFHRHRAILILQALIWLDPRFVFGLAHAFSSEALIRNSSQKYKKQYSAADK